MGKESISVPTVELLSADVKGEYNTTPAFEAEARKQSCRLFSSAFFHLKQMRKHHKGLGRMVDFPSSTRQDNSEQS